MKLKSFGCSFIYGSELANRDHTWPAIIADKLGLEHQNHGIEGAGNLRILHEIFNHAHRDDRVIVQWTWIDRFDYVAVPDEKWYTITPSASDSLSSIYYRDLHSQYKDMFTNLVYVKTALEHLYLVGARYVMTYMDHLLFETVQDSWHHGRAVTGLQQQTQPHMTLFDGLTFLEWSRANHYPESALWHPLDEAHGQAAELMLPIIESILRKA